MLITSSNPQNRRQVFKRLGGVGLATATCMLPSVAKPPQSKSIDIASAEFETYAAFIAHEHRLVLQMQHYHKYSRTARQAAEWVWENSYALPLLYFPDNTAVETLVCRHSPQTPMHRAGLIVPTLGLS